MISNKIIICCIACIFVIILLYSYNKISISLSILQDTISRNNIKNDGVSYYRLDHLNYHKPSLDVIESFRNAFESQGQVLEKAAKYKDATWIMFDTLNFIDEYMARLHIPLACTHIYGLHGTDLMASKSALVESFRDHLTKVTCEKYLPETYVTSNQNDLRILKQVLKEDDSIVWILKKNIQRQEGTKLCNDANVILNELNEYVVIQKVLQNPYLVSGHKINIRIYVLLTSHMDHIRFYYYNDGFIYYTPKKFKENSLDSDEVITTGYIDRSIYETNPLTLKELLRKMPNMQRLAEEIHTSCMNLKNAFHSSLKRKNASNKSCHKFLIMGLDVAPAEDLTCKIMEINKGPDLSYKDERDRNVKLNMVINALQIVNLLPSNMTSNVGNQFIEI